MEINIADYNAVRIKHQADLGTPSELSRVIKKECKFLSTSMPMNFYVVHGFIEKLNEKTYQFSRKPWTYIEISKAIQECIVENKRRNQKQREIKREKKLTEEMCIDFLKKKGYIIRKLIPEHWEEL